MATEKRQRQDQRRQEKLKEVVAITEKQKTAKKRKRLLTFLIPGVLLVGVALFWRNGDSGDDTVAADSGAAATTIPAVTTTSLPPEIAKKPDVSIPSAAPTKLEINDIATGTGPAAVKGSDLKVNYVGVVVESKKQFASTWDATPPSLFEIKGLGQGGIIDGLAEGLIGIKQGGRRQIVVPASKAYGKEGSAALGIKPSESLVYVVDAVEVIPPTK